MPTTVVAYYRVSTKRQGESGLALEGQRAAVQQYVESEGATLAGSYTEVESGKSSDREQLARAVAHARRMNATLVVAKLDRLARNVAFTSTLMDSRVDFVCCDQPHATRFTMHILAAVAEEEARRISDRTKAALAAAKARGVKLGSAREGHWNGREDKRMAGLAKAQQKAAAARRRAADEAYVDLVPEMREMRDSGLSLRAIAARLNDAGHQTRRGKSWNPMQVRNVLKRFDT